jgi:hypothetical protein
LLKPQGLVPTQFVEREANTYLVYQKQFEETKVPSQMKKLNLELFRYSDIEDYNNPMKDKSNSIRQLVKKLAYAVNYKKI